MEGFLLTSTNIIPSIMNFINKFEPDFLSSAHEKRFLNLDQLEVSLGGTSQYKFIVDEYLKYKVLKN